MAGVAAVVVAAGRGQRAGGDVPKQYRTIAGVAVLRQILSTFAAHPSIAFVKFAAMAEGARIATRQLWGRA